MYVHRLAKVRELLEKAEANRTERRMLLPDYSNKEFAEILRKLRKKMAENRDMPYSQRRSAWMPLGPMELAILEKQLEQYQAERRLIISNRAHDQLDIMRLNMAEGRPVIDGPTFRDAAHELFAQLAQEVLVRFMGTLHAGLVLPLRAALACLTTYQRLGLDNLGLLGIARNEKTAEPDIRYFERAPKVGPLVDAYLVVDPMLATGGSLEQTLLWLKDMNVNLEKVFIQCVIAAPEGLDYILNRYPVQIFASAVDGGLDKNAYIKDVGIGDFGDHYMRGITVPEMQELWGKPGFLNDNEIKVIAQRTASIAAD